MIKTRLKKYPFEIKNRLYMNITMYYNAPDNLVAVMDCGGDLQMLYGAANKESYNKLLTAVNGIGKTM